MAKLVKIQGRNNEVIYINPDQVLAILPINDSAQRHLDKQKGVLGKIESEAVGCIINLSNDGMIASIESQDIIANKFSA